MQRLAMALLLAVLGGCAGSGGGAAAPPIRTKVMDVIPVQARVSAIDREQRHVTIVDDAGDEAVFQADEAVANFDRIEIGDEVVGKLVGALAIEIRPPSPDEAAAGAWMTQAAGRAQPGERPAGVFVRQVTGVFTIEAFDRAAGRATLRGPTGVVYEIPVRDPLRFEGVAAGDTVVATYTESVRLAVRGPGAPAGAAPAP